MFTILAAGDWSMEQIHVRRTGAPRRIVPEVEAIIDIEWDKLLQRPGVKLFDGPMVRLVSFTASAERLDLELSETSYKPFVGTHMARPDLVDLYGREVMANPVGVSTLLHSSDDYLLMGWRQASLAYYPSRVHPFAGAMEPEDDGPVEAVWRELREELSLDRSEAEDVRCIGIVDEGTLRMAEMVYLAHCSKTKAELIAALDADEHQDAWSIQATSDEIDRTFATDRVLTPVARASLLLWGRLRFGQAWFESRIDAARG